jgi:UDP-2-acetamido-3-amino-2,3-dideoxy-glucuronate N-acetyltransferase
MKYFVHDTSIIDNGAIIGNDTKIWHWSHISSSSIIGNNCSIGQNVYIGNNVRIGNNVKIQNNVSIYEGVELEDYVFCGPSMVFTNVKNPRSAINQKNKFLKTFVKKGATLGANCTIVCGISIDEFSFVGAGSLVNKNLKKFGLYVGVPATQIGWVDISGKKLNLPLYTDKEIFNINSNNKYVLKNSNLDIVND